MAQAVEEHRHAHGRKLHGLEPLGQRHGGRMHENGVEGAADFQGQAALGARLLGQFGSAVHGSLFPADNQLAGAVVVADLHHAQGGSLLTAGLQLVAVQHQDGGHAAVQALGRLGHGLAAEGHQLHSTLGVQHIGTFQRRVLAQ